MNVNQDTNYEELARCTDSFNGAQLKAVCVEAGMIALRRGATELSHEDYMEGGWVWFRLNHCSIRAITAVIMLKEQSKILNQHSCNLLEEGNLSKGTILYCFLITSGEDKGTIKVQYKMV